MQELKTSKLGSLVESLDERSLLCRLDSGFSSYFCQHRFPVQSLISLPQDTFGAACGADLDLDFGLLEEKDFALQLSANLRLPWSLGELTKQWLKRFGLDPERRNNRRPQMVLSTHFQVKKGGMDLYAAISPVEENLSPWSRGVCRIPKDAKALSRAEQKLLEALELLALDSWNAKEGESLQALDLGASPGGWSRILSQLGYSVQAVDPADLDPKLAACQSIRHHKTTAGAFLEKDSEIYRLLVCDMKMDALMAANLMVQCRERLQDGGALILTLKLPKGDKTLSETRQAVEKIKRAYTVVQARQLYFNRQEVTVIARPRVA